MIESVQARLLRILTPRSTGPQPAFNGALIALVMATRLKLATTAPRPLPARRDPGAARAYILRHRN